MAEESSDSPFDQLGSGRHGAGGHNNALCLFYSASMTESSSATIQSSRAPNSWIASLRSKHDQSSRDGLEGGQHGHKLSAGTPSSRSCSSLMNDPFASPISNRAFFRSSSLESIQRNRRLRQLALQSTTKVRSLIARESTAEAERRRYIQSVLERRRLESLEGRERFIRRPLENIIRQRAANQCLIQQQQQQQQRQTIRLWDVAVASRRQSILKDGSRPERRCAQRWLSKQSERRVRFNVQRPVVAIQASVDDDDSDRDDREPDDANKDSGDVREKLPTLLASEEPGVDSEPIGNNNRPKIVERLPLLSTPLFDDNPPRAGSAGPSWVERQVAKVKRRKLWVQQQQQQQQQQQLDREKDDVNKKENSRPSVRMRVLKRSLSLLVNVSSGESDSGASTDSLLLPDSGDGSIECATIPLVRDGRVLAWEIWLDKEEEEDEELKGKEKDEEVEMIPDAYSGWPHFPIRLAVGIEERQRNLEEKRASRKKMSTSWKALSSNSLIRRKRFAKSLSMAVLRFKRRDNTDAAAAKSLLTIHQRSTTDLDAAAGRLTGQHQMNAVPTPKKAGKSTTLLSAGNIVDDVLDGRASKDQLLSTSSGSMTRQLAIIPEEMVVAQPVCTGLDQESSHSVSQEEDCGNHQRPRDEIPPPPDEISDTVIVDDPLETLVATRPICESPVMTDHLASNATARPNDLATPSESISPPPPAADSVLSNEMYPLSVVDSAVVAVAVAAAAAPADGDELDRLISSPVGAIDDLSSTERISENLEETIIREVDWLDGINKEEMNEEEEEEEGRASTTRVQSGQETRPASPITTFVIRPASPITLSSDCCFAPLDEAVIIQAAKLEDRLTCWTSQEESATTGDVEPTFWPARPAWIMASISNQQQDVNNDARDNQQYSTMAVSFRRDFEASDEAATPPLVLESTTLEENIKEVPNVSSIISLVSTTTQTEPAGRAEQVLPSDAPVLKSQRLCSSSSVSSSASSSSRRPVETDTDECQCLHRAVLTCLLPDAADTLSSLESIRRHLKQARLRQQSAKVGRRPFPADPQ